MNSKSRLLWIADAPAPAGVAEMLGDEVELETWDIDQPVAERLASSRVALVSPNGSSGDADRMSALAQQFQQAAAVGIFLLPSDSSDLERILYETNAPVVCLPANASAEQIKAMVQGVLSLQPVIGNLQSEVLSARQLKMLSEQRMEELDEEMKLAARLQRDFLPRKMPEVGSSRFSVLFRPASFVSGDIYEVRRLDETHVGFYVADAVGHGMPAALLTMFIKHALQTKRIVGNTYQIVPPHASLAELNADICEQNLSSCQFCTAVYGVLDTETLRLSFARAGHPEPLLLPAAGGVERLWADGGLLGVFPEEQYVTREIQLSPGDRVIFYTDGVEDGLHAREGSPQRDIEKILAPMLRLPRDEMLLSLTAKIEQCSTPSMPDDDMTVMVLDV